MGGGLAASICEGAIVGAASEALISVGTQTIQNGFENISGLEVLKSAVIGAISGFIAGGVFGGIKYVASAGKISYAISGVEKAKTSVDNAFIPLNSVSKFINMPYAGKNIVNAIGIAASNYNAAYTNLIIANLNNTLYHLVVSGAYETAQFGLKQGVVYLISLFW